MVIAATSTVRAQSLFEQLVMPGPLVAAHAKLAKECGNCHEPFSHGTQTELCLTCHKETRADRQTAKGFHGRDPSASKQECIHCHTDHIGRNADIVQLDRETFDHAFTNFALRDAHASVPCTACHAQSAKFRDASGRCFDCHKTEDPHKGRLGEACDNCHAETAWPRVKAFDHEKTKFLLREAHRTVPCAACHVNERYRDLGRACADCHRVEDVHTGRYGAKCDSCHDQSKWATIHFDHDKATKFPLRAAHAKIKCDACHMGDLYRDKLATTCVSCHRKDDPHQGQLGSRCEQCHADASWRRVVSFDHDVTRFPLIGRHAIVPCEECHRSRCSKARRWLAPLATRTSITKGVSRRNAGSATTRIVGRDGASTTARRRDPLTGAHSALDCQPATSPGTWRRSHWPRIAIPATGRTTRIAAHSGADANAATPRSRSNRSASRHEGDQARRHQRLQLRAGIA